MSLAHLSTRATIHAHRTAAPVLPLLLERAASAASDDLEGLRLADQAVKAARREGWSDALLGHALMLQATYAQRLSDCALAYESALEASAVLGRAGDVLQRAKALNCCFMSCIEAGDLVRGLAHATAALALAEAADDPFQRATLLQNQAVVFEMIGDFDSALERLEPAASLYDRLRDGGPGAFSARVRAAGIHLAQADAAVAAGSDGEAHREAAQRAMPALRADAEPEALQMWSSIQARLGHVAAAREGAGVCVASARRHRTNRRCRVHALLALADCHLAGGRPTRALPCLQQAIRLLRASPHHARLGTTERRLADLHARLGQHAEALDWIRRAEADDARLKVERHAVRWRFAKSDREEMRRRSLPDDVQGHVQRLDVIGRLIAEIHHALAQPLAAARATLQQLLDAGVSAASGDSLRTALDHVVEQVDAASALVSQLKMFSYRASPQPSEVTLHLALQEAWSGASLWRRGRAKSLVVEAQQRSMVHVDAQRLAVLLRILVIEADRANPAGDLIAGIACNGTQCCLTLGFGPVDPARVAARVGVTLCVEIAHEVGGELTWETAPDAQVQLHLRLPLMNTA